MLSTVIVLAVILLVVLLTCVPYLATIVLAHTPAERATADASPIFGVTIPPGNKPWELIAPGREAKSRDYVFTRLAP